VDVVVALMRIVIVVNVDVSAATLVVLEASRLLYQNYIVDTIMMITMMTIITLLL
jgi:hypothetical protein